MNQAFYKLDKETQKSILDSAYDVFTDTPYDQASTNDIVKHAGISKGRLFYYFKNKQTLFHFLIKHALAYIKEAYLDHLSLEEPDFIKRYERVAKIKQAAYNKEPHLFAFNSYIYLHEKDRIPNDLLTIMEDYMKHVESLLYKDIDTRLFRDDIPKQLIIELLTYSLEGYQNQLIETFKTINIKSKDMTPYYEDYELFLQTLRKLYYK